MAASTADAFAGAPLRNAGARQPAPARRHRRWWPLAIAPRRGLWGFDWRDPSLNQASRAAGPQPGRARRRLRRRPALPAVRPRRLAAGAGGAELGRCGWRSAGRSPGRGCRSSACRWRCWRWPAFLAMPAAPAAGAWPLRAGSAGPSATCNGAGSSRGSARPASPPPASAPALLLCITALGRALGRGPVGRRQGRRAARSGSGAALGDAAGAATLRSGRLVRDGMRGIELARRRRPGATRRRPGRGGRGRPGRAPRAAQARARGAGRADRRPRAAPARARGAPPPPERAAAGGDRGRRRRTAQAGTRAGAFARTSWTTSFELPGLDLLAPVKTIAGPGESPQALAETSRQLETVLDDFGVRGEIIDAKTGPVVTLYELEPAPGTRAARVISLADDIARSLCALLGARRRGARAAT